MFVGRTTTRVTTNTTGVTINTTAAKNTIHDPISRLLILINSISSPRKSSSQLRNIINETDKSTVRASIKNQNRESVKFRNGRYHPDNNDLKIIRNIVLSKKSFPGLFTGFVTIGGMVGYCCIEEIKRRNLQRWDVIYNENWHRHNKNTIFASYRTQQYQNYPTNK